MFNKPNLLKLLFLIFTINNINLCFASDIDTGKQVINIINNSDSTMIVSHDIPSETEAKINIELKKIDLANDLLKSGILNDSEEQIINAIPKTGWNSVNNGCGIDLLPQGNNYTYIRL